MIVFSQEDLNALKTHNVHQLLNLVVERLCYELDAIAELSTSEKEGINASEIQIAMIAISDVCHKHRSILAQIGYPEGARPYIRGATHELPTVESTDGDYPVIG